MRRLTASLLFGLLVLGLLGGCANPPAAPAPPTRPATPSPVVATKYTLILPAGATPLPTPALPPDGFIEENVGKLCLEPHGGGVRAVWYPYGWPTGCGMEVQRLGDVRVDLPAHSITLYTRLVYIDPLGPRSTHTCLAGATEPLPMQFNYVGHEIGRYGSCSVWWGANKLADITIGQALGQTVCLTQNP
jgi:hypothetical protein